MDDQAANLEEQVRLARSGDRGARELIARRALRLSLRTATALLGPERAEDVAQDSAVDVLRSLGRLRDPAAFDAWVHRICVRRVMRASKRRGKAARMESPLSASSEEAARRESDPSEIDTMIRWSGLWAEVARLPERQRIALVLRYVHDLPDETIAAVLGCRRGTVHALLSRARSSLRAAPEVVQLASTTTGGA